MDVLISKIDEMQNDLIKMRKSLKILTKQQKLKILQLRKVNLRFAINLQPKNLISDMPFLPL